MSPACPVFGFVIQLRLCSGIDEENFANSFAKFLATRALAIDGVLPVLLVSGDGMQATDADRDAVRSWLAKQPEVAQFEVGPLSDVGSAA